MDEFNDAGFKANFSLAIYNDSANESVHRCTMSVMQGTMLVVINSLLVPVGTIGNLLIILAILNTPQLLRRVSNFYLLSLAVADMLVTMLSQPLLVIWLGFVTFTGHCIPGLNQAYDISVNILCGSSLFHLAVISIDRAISILKPHQYRSIMSKRRVKIVVATCWVVALVIVGFRIPFPKPASFFGICLFFGGYILFICSYGAIIYKVMHTSSLNIRRNSTGRQTKMSSADLVNRAMEKRVCEAVGIVTLIFSLCWLPVFVYLIVTKGQLNTVTYSWIRTLYLFNSSVNFIVYSWRIDHFRVAYRKIFNRVFHRFSEISGIYELPTTNVSRVASSSRTHTGGTASEAIDITSKNN